MKESRDIWSIFIPTGTPDDNGLLSAQLWDLGTIGIEESEAGLRAYFDHATNPMLIQAAFDEPGGRIEWQKPSTAVNEASDWEPMLVGRRFVIVPVERLVLPIDAAMAFGSGRHETTQLCLEALEQCTIYGQKVVDMGCGSGILALAAQKLGAASVIAADIDEASITIARRHFQGPVFVGSADCLPSAYADVVICNITQKVNDRISSDLQRITKPHGRVIVSGFLSASTPLNFHAEQVFRRGDWECWICDPARISASAGDEHSNVHLARWWI